MPLPPPLLLLHAPDSAAAPPAALQLLMLPPAGPLPSTHCWLLWPVLAGVGAAGGGVRVIVRREASQQMRSSSSVIDWRVGVSSTRTTTSEDSSSLSRVAVLVGAVAFAGEGPSTSMVSLAWHAGVPEDMGRGV
eukprot:1159886-Pelagomonas_calceolata.AAC.9